MANITNFVYCLNAERIPSTKNHGDSINAIGVLSVLIPEFVPGTYSFSIIFSVLDMDISANNEIQITFSREGDSANLVDTGIITVPPVEKNEDIEVPPTYEGLNMSMDFRNVVFEREGLYITKIIFNNVLLGEYSIYVKGKR